MKAIVLCGGLGSRLGELTRHTPKPLIPVAGRPFLAHVLDQLCMPEIDGFILATGFLADQVASLMGNSWQNRPIFYSAEPKALGTGGAICLAMHEFDLDEALVANGDTLFSCDLSGLFLDFKHTDAMTQIALRHVEDCSRYGRVVTSQTGRVVGFGEKGHAGPGVINAGIYLQKRSPLEGFGTAPFSFESEYLAREYGNLSIHGTLCEGYFIDIGVPEDLENARLDLPCSLNETRS